MAETNATTISPDSLNDKFRVRLAACLAEMEDAEEPHARG
jgi:hypothetical protein